MADYTPLQFEAHASNPLRGCALIYDLEGFSRFFNQPDVQHYMSVYLNHIIEGVSLCFRAGQARGLVAPRDVTIQDLTFPIHEKFMGDGMLYVWNLQALSPDDQKSFLAALCNRLWNIKTHFRELVTAASEDVPVVDVPSRIRFGLAAGTMFELTPKEGKPHEFIGICINLASRLQTYCPELGFIASARIDLSKKILEDNGYEKVVAKNIKGFPKEVVLVDKDEFAKLPDNVRAELFDPYNP